MSFSPTPKQALVLWKLLITQEKPKKSELKPKLTKEELDELEKEGLLEIVERKKLREEGKIDLKGRGKHAVLGKNALTWASSNFDIELYSSKYTKAVTPLITELLRLVALNMDARDISLSDFLGVSDNAVEIPEDLEEPICKAYLSLSNGRYKVRVRLADLRRQLGGLPREEVDKTLGEMELDGKLSLMKLDDPTDIFPADEEAAIDLGGAKRHILYMKK